MADVQNIVAQKWLANTPAILSSTTALALNANRGSWGIQNLGTNPLYVLLGTPCSTTVFHRILKGCSVQDDGTGGTIDESTGVVYTGIITIAGTSPRYVVLEI